MFRVVNIPAARLRHAIAKSDRNIFWPGRKAMPRVKDVPGVETLDEWRSLGFDRSSLARNPLLMKMPGGGYTLKPESPAFALGFRSIDVTRIGPRNGDGRVRHHGKRNSA